MENNNTVNRQRQEYISTLGREVDQEDGGSSRERMRQDDDDDNLQLFYFNKEILFTTLHLFQFATIAKLISLYKEMNGFSFCFQVYSD